MKIYFKNRAARLKRRINDSCERCPFFNILDPCPCNTSTIVDCYCVGYWVDGESLDIFRV